MSDDLPAADLEAPPAAAAAPHEPRNFAALVLHTVVFRIGWTFKQESIIMAAFLDAIAGQDWVRGLLPTLRLGQNVSPLLWAGALRDSPSKKLPLTAFTLLISAPYLVLAVLWWRLAGQTQAWLPAVFLALYFAFSVLYGIQQLALGTAQGKLIRPRRRGRLLWVAQLAGLPPVIVLMKLSMPHWLAEPAAGFVWIFAAAGGCFILAALAAAWLREPADPILPARRSAGRGIRAAAGETWRVLREDANLRVLVAVVLLFSGVLLLAPHFQAYARVRFALTKPEMAPLATDWLIVQTISVSLFSFALGPLADWRGNRLALRLLLVGGAAAPVLAVALGQLPPALGKQWYWLVYIPQGLSPLLMQLATNYTLEIARHEHHPRYLGTLTGFLAVPFLFSPLLGQAITVLGFESAFLSVAVLAALAAALTFKLREPRRA